MKLTRYGMREWLGGGIIALILLAAAAVIAVQYSKNLGMGFGAFVVLYWLYIAFFFRVPNRRIPNDPSLILSPADGVIQDMEVIPAGKLSISQNQDMVRIGIFLSVFDVHVNRAPTDMTVINKLCRPGKYLDARNCHASRDNESVLLRGIAQVAGWEFSIGVRQISGAIARRIVCPVEVGSKLRRGEIYGMIKFGSRTELFLPVSDRIRIRAQVGDRVHSGTYVMAEVLEEHNIEEK